VNAQNSLGQTPLMLAIQNQDRAMIALLMKNGADAAIKDGQGRDSREWAQRYQVPAETLGEVKTSI
jgi:ankyrin repeat protein